jgi:hypothetical protein
MSINSLDDTTNFRMFVKIRNMLDDTLSIPIVTFLVITLPFLLPLALLCCFLLYVAQSIWLSIASLFYSSTSSFTPTSSNPAVPTEPTLSPRQRQLAWHAYVKHIMSTRTDAFAGIKKFREKLTIIKGIREENTAAYDTFVADWKQKQKQQP